ncbi:hypothetical protein GOQ27_16310 [Clostridium sp. D2Q-11]|uniref:Uncharacterized protein n=1 Tax=Anaeromonas frigoriresistens TaxID=2683708 RepID=A0A942V2Q2_9FIRM|nr:hypothetical protein [Anaeromonas frigoriresistens]MBS4540042.1 hypothetical protein [Anaeromonas frigoriresistens]
MKRYRYILFIILVFTILLNNTICLGYNDSRVSNFYIVVINRLTLEDIDELESLKKIISEGSIGLMNPKGASSYTNYEGFGTLNSTNKILAKVENYYPIDISKEQGLLGQDTIVDSNNSMIEQIIDTNKNSLYNPDIGIIGKILHLNNIKTAVFDYSDTADTFVGKTKLIAMDKEGEVDYTSIYYSNYNNEDDISNYYNNIFNNLSRVKDSSDFIVIDTENLNNTLSSRIDTLNRIDNFLNVMINNIDKSKDKMIIISPNIQEELSKGLTPIVIWGKDIKRGILYSDSTKREGILTNLDVAPYIIESFGISSEYLDSSGVVNIERESNFDYIKNINNIINRTSNIREETFKIVTILGFIFLFLYLILNIFRIKNLYISILLEHTTYIFILVPFVLLISSIFDNNIYFTMIFLAVLLVLFKVRGINPKYICGLTFITIVIDLLNGSKLIASSVLGYDPLIGARYYGLGNEMAGILIFNMIYFTKIMIKNNEGLKILFIYFFTFIIVISPSWGSNLGAGLSILSMLLYIIYQGLKEKNHHRIIMKIISFGIIIISMVIVYIMFFSIEESHISEFLNKISSHGVVSVLDIFKRKILVNIRLLGDSMWNKILFITIPTICILLNQLTKNNIVEKQELLLINSLIVGSIVGFLVNDSGLLLSALANLYLSIFLIYVTIIKGKYKGSE